MKRRYAVFAVVFAVSMLIGLEAIEAVNANPFLFGPYIGILSPEQFNKKTYQTSTISIEIQIETPIDYPKIIKIYYILDLNYSSNYNPQKPLSTSKPQSSTYKGEGSISYLGTGTLKNLSNGTHTLDAYAVDAQDKTIKSGTRNFLVNTTSNYPTANTGQPLALSNLTIALAIIAIVIVASISLVYFKNHKPKTEIVKKT